MMMVMMMMSRWGRGKRQEAYLSNSISEAYLSKVNSTSSAFGLSVLSLNDRVGWIWMVMVMIIFVA